MKNVVIFHGKPKRERYEDPDLPKPHEANWLPWIKSELDKIDVPTSIPALPKPYNPDYEAWKDTFEGLRVDVGEGTGMVGHSAGAEFALRWLSENPIPLERLVLVAPWSDTKRKYGEFSEYRVDPGLARRIGRITVFNSLDDSPAIQARVASIRELISGVAYREFSNHGHFMLGNNMQTEELPELLEEMIG